MVTLTVLYGRPTDPEAFETYYAEHHMPLVETIPGLGRHEASKALAAAGGGEPAFYRSFVFWFDSEQDLEAALETEPGRAAAADLKNFATGGATLFVSEVC